MPPHGATVATTRGYLLASYAGVVKIEWPDLRKVVVASGKPEAAQDAVQQ